MTDWISQMTEPQAAETVQKETDWADMVTSGIPTGDGELQPPNINVRNIPDKQAGMLDIAGASFSSSPKETVQWYASQLYPDEPMEQALKRFGTDENGQLYHVPDWKNPNQAAYVFPQGWSPGEFAKRLATGVGKSLPIGAETATGILTAPLALGGPGGFAASVGATGVAAAAGERARQGIGDLFMGEAADTDLNFGDIALEGTLAAVGQGVGGGIARHGNRNMVQDVNRLDLSKAREVYDKAGRIGVDITPAEATGLSSLKTQQKRLGNLPNTQDEVEAFYRERDDQIYSAWDGFLNSLSKASDPEEIAETARRTAQEAIEDVKEARSRRASPLYRQAFEENAEVDLSSVRGMVEENMDAPGTLGTQMKQIAKMLNVRSPDEVLEEGAEEAVDEVAPLTLKRLDLIKKDLDNRIETAPQSGIGRSIRHEIQGVRDALRDAMKEASPSYKQALQTFAEESTGVDKMINSSVRILSELGDEKLIRAAKSVIDPNTRTAQSVFRARGVIEGKNPEAWQGLKRIYLQDEMMRAFRPSQTGEVINPAGKLYSTLMAGPRSRVIKASMTDTEWRRFTDLMDVMKTASQVKRVGSDTEWNKIINEAEKDKARGIIGKVLRNVYPPQALHNLDEFLTNRAIDKNAEKLTDVLIKGDKEALETLRHLKIIAPGSPTYRILLGHLLSQGSSTVAPSEERQNLFRERLSPKTRLPSLPQGTEPSNQ